MLTNRVCRIAMLLAVLPLASLAHAGLRVEVVAFTPPGTPPDAWLSTRVQPPCHAVALRDGVGAESAFSGNGDCVRVAGYEAAFGGFAGISANALPAIAGKLRTGGYAPLLTKSWTQVGTTVAPVLLRGGRVQAGRQELEGTIALSGNEKAPDVTLEFTLTQMDGARPRYATLKETRRLRPGERNYFDHPLFGIILQVTNTP